MRIVEHCGIAPPPPTQWRATFNICQLIDAVIKHYQARQLNKEDAVDRCKWRKVIKEVH